MTEHLAECPKFALRYTISRCICDALRRCERRVRFSVSQEGAMETGWKAGVQAAREAVLALNLSDHYRMQCEPMEDPVDWSQHKNCDPEEDTLAAIDALRGDR